MIMIVIIVTILLNRSNATNSNHDNGTNQSIIIIIIIVTLVIVVILTCPGEGHHMSRGGRGRVERAADPRPAQTSASYAQLLMNYLFCFCINAGFCVRYELH